MILLAFCNGASGKNHADHRHASMHLYSTVCDGNERTSVRRPSTKLSAKRWAKHLLSPIYADSTEYYGRKTKRCSRVHQAHIRITSSHALHLNCQVGSGKMDVKEEDDAPCMEMTKLVCHSSTKSVAQKGQHIRFCAS